MDKKEIMQHVDHTILTPTATWEQVKKICDQGMAYHTASVCIPPCYVRKAEEYVGDRLKICTVIGFPNGYNTPEVKVFEAVKDACHGRILKVIVEACQLTEEEKIAVCRVVSMSGADFIKTSTGFSTGGATVEDVKLFRHRRHPRHQPRRRRLPLHLSHHPDRP